MDDWPLLLVRARHHAVAGHLWARTRALGLSLPSDVEATLARRDAEDELWFLHLSASLAELSAALTRAGVPHVALKGPALAVRVASPPHLRRSTDLDLLVAPEDLAPAIRAVERLGYARLRGSHLREHTATHLAHETAPGLDLHHAAHVGLGRIVPASALLDGARTVSVGGVEVGVPPAAEELAYLALHAAGHRFERLAWLLDISQLLVGGEVTREAAHEAALRLGAARALSMTHAELDRARGAGGRHPWARLVTLDEERAWSSLARAGLNLLTSVALADDPVDGARAARGKIARDLAPRLRALAGRER